MRVITRHTLALTSFLLLAACGGGDGPTSPKPGQGGFTATVSGAASKSLSGQAGFLVTTNLFTIALNNTAGTGSIQFSRLAGVPAVGTYQLDANAEPSSGAFVAIYSGGGQENYIASTGSLTITSSSADRIAGTFSFTGTGGTSGSASVSVSGSFDAPRLSAQ